MLAIEPSPDELRHLPSKRDFVFLSREEALGVFERRLEDGTKKYGAPCENELEGARMATWQGRAEDGTAIRVRLVLQDFRVTVSVALDAA